MRGWGCAGEGVRRAARPPESLSCGLGDVQFSVASDDNSEFWLSPDESPAGAQLVAYVGKVPWTPQHARPGPAPTRPSVFSGPPAASVTSSF